MLHTEIHQKLTSVFRDVFDNPALEISEATTAKDVEGWDSITHVNLIVAVEEAFGTSFTTKDVKGLTNVGDLIRLIAKRSA
ncbi:MAG: acyl carrier protein [Verrucomicrobia bacterium]|nr:MAG: acyl carrier protein [Verrucomicrobiota bacterium]